MSVNPLPIPTFEAELHGTGKYRALNSVADLAEALLYRWPEGKRRGRAYRKARENCLLALEGKASAERAVRSFIEAAEEAGIGTRP